MKRADRAKRAVIVAGALLGAGAWTVPAALAADAAAGKAKSSMCAACHGPTGISQAPIYPNLAGQKEQYLLGAMKQYKSGKRDNPIMKPMMAPLSETDMANLAAYFSSLGAK